MKPAGRANTTCYGCYYLTSDENMIKVERGDMRDKMGIGCCALRCDLKKRYLTHKEVLETPHWCPQLPV